MRYLKIGFLIIGMLLLQLVVSADVRAGAPTDQVRQTADQVLTLLRNPQFKGADKESQRRERLREIIGNRFNFEEMAKRSLGASWRRVSAEDQKRFVELFTDLLEKSYADQIESYNGEKIVYGRENIAQDQAEVDTKVINKKGQEFTVNYKLQSNQGDWKVYDVMIDNVSLVNNYRSQFNRILAKSSFDDLLKKLEAKSPEIHDVRT
jgi:phospholipid transport system substrate-binding protein